MSPSRLTRRRPGTPVRHHRVVSDGERLAIQVQQLLDELCADLGLCLPPCKQRRLREAPPLDVDAFTDAVLIAEGLDPGLNRRLREQAQKRVLNRISKWTMNDTRSAQT